MSGVPPAAHLWPVRVYYEDTDLAGIVYYANYLRFLERGRTEALRALGVDQARLKAEAGLVFVVTRVEIDYRAPARFDEEIAVATWLAEPGRARAVLAQAATRGGERLVDARVTVACMDAAGRPSRMPEPVRAALDRIAVKE